MTLRKKLLITIACLSCILCVLVTGTIAWLTASTEEITNEFTPSNVDVELVEAAFDGKMVPGKDIDQTATVTVTNDIDCYVFLVVEESFEDITYTEKGNAKTAGFSDFLTYAVATGWQEVTAGSGVYYREVKVADTNKVFNVLEGNKVTVKNTVTKAMMDALYENGVVSSNIPKLSFQAYVCQSEGFDDAAAAWAEASK